MTGAQGPRGPAEYLDLSLGDLLEGLVLHAFEENAGFESTTLDKIEQLEAIYGLDLGAEDSDGLTEG